MVTAIRDNNGNIKEKVKMKSSLNTCTEDSCVRMWQQPNGSGNTGKRKVSEKFAKKDHWKKE